MYKKFYAPVCQYFRYSRYGHPYTSDKSHCGNRSNFILGKILTQVSSKTILVISVLVLAAGGVVLQLAISHAVITAGLILLGVGLAAGFPVMLGYVGDRYKAVSGTAFSIVISMALIGIGIFCSK